jgi:gluconolactonase
MEGQGLPDGVQVSAVWVDCAKHQLLLPAAHAVLPSTFERHAFKEGILNTRSTHGLIIPCRASPFVASHASFLKVLGPAPSVKVIATGEAGFAHEAGVWVDKTEEVWFTSNLRKDPTTAEASVNISKLHVPSGQVTEVTIELAKRGNGACPYGDYILFCEQGCGPGLPSSLVAVNPLDPLDAFVVLNNFHGRAFNSLNDAIVLPPPLTRVRNQQPTIRGANVTPNGSSCHAATPGSTIWFTDPPYGFEQGFRDPCQLPPQVYVFEPRSGAVRVVADGFEHPNGIAFSPDCSTCYITDTSHIHGSGRLDPTLQSTM